MALRALYDVPAPAKLNMFLHVVGRRADGLHLLQSPFVLIDWSDRLHFERRDDGRLARHDLGPALPADDLCLRAARVLQNAAGTSFGVDISVLKNVPSGAGMGGGSSDAASTLLALNRLWQIGWPRSRLAALGLTLGADVPFFVAGDNAFVEGVGERLRPLPWPTSRYAVVKPGVSLGTRTIFESSELVRDTAAVIVAGSFEEAKNISLVHSWVHGFGRNDLQLPAESRCPEVGQAARWLDARFGNSRMTGSGSAVFARVETDESSITFNAPGEAAFTNDALPSAWIKRICSSLVAHPLAGWAV